jgi:hypothetical protein
MLLQPVNMPEPKLPEQPESIKLKKKETDKEVAVSAMQSEYRQLPVNHALTVTPITLFFISELPDVSDDTFVNPRPY